MRRPPVIQRENLPTAVGQRISNCVWSRVASHHSRRVEQIQHRDQMFEPMVSLSQTGCAIWRRPKGDHVQPCDLVQPKATREHLLVRIAVLGPPLHIPDSEGGPFGKACSVAGLGSYRPPPTSSSWPARSARSSSTPPSQPRRPSRSSLSTRSTSPAATTSGRSSASPPATNLLQGTGRRFVSWSDRWA